eukprot:TRINITY_DN71292_c0_g1_i1.p1 TRINITY_DN71292_c0_g1~~TRINITY_DN71292_c0_g1_i1.p1  ORF type:complete len:812 (+),score=274.24 TRINITY_DN71292_c0_g1_i1:98-2437(+)
MAHAVHSDSDDNDIDLGDEVSDDIQMGYAAAQMRRRNRRFVCCLALTVFAVFGGTVWVVLANPPERGSSEAADIRYAAKAEVKWTAAELSEWCSSTRRKAEELVAFALSQNPSSPRSAAAGEVLAALNSVDVLLGNAASSAELTESVAPEKATRDAATACYLNISAYWGALSRDPQLYGVFKAASSPDVGDAAQRRWVSVTALAYKQSGVDLPAEKRAELQNITDQLDALGAQYEDVLDSSRGVVTRDVADSAALEGLSAEYIAQRTKGDVVEISTDYPDYIPAMRYARNATLRKELYRLNLQRGMKEGNVETLEKVLRLRAQAAALLGYANWAEYSMAEQTVGGARAARAFLESAADSGGDLSVRSRSQRELGEMALLKGADWAAGRYSYCCGCNCCDCPETTSDPSGKDSAKIEAWDSAYYKELLRNRSYSFDSARLSEYFSYKLVRTGILEFVSEMFGVMSTRTVGARTWHPDVEAWELRWADKGPGSPAIGRYYLDMFPREGKYKHAAQFPLRKGVGPRRLAPGVDPQIPEAALVCNFPKSGPMEHGQVVTFFHEFGHLLHDTLSGQGRDWAALSGAGAVAMDFVEAPSQFDELWAQDSATLRQFARNRDGEELPEALMEDLRNADKFARGLDTMQQLFYSMVSLEFHSLSPADAESFNSTAKLIELQSSYSPYPHLPGTAFQANFGHLIGYSSNYYVYQWSLSIARDFAATFRQSKGGLRDVDTARRYRDVVLAPGGLYPSQDLVRNFTGHWPPRLEEGYFAYLRETPEPRQRH